MKSRGPITTRSTRRPAVAETAAGRQCHISIQGPDLRHNDGSRHIAAVDLDVKRPTREGRAHTRLEHVHIGDLNLHGIGEPLAGGQPPDRVPSLARHPDVHVIRAVYERALFVARCRVEVPHILPAQVIVLRLNPAGDGTGRAAEGTACGIVAVADQDRSRAGHNNLSVRLNIDIISSAMRRRSVWTMPPAPKPSSNVPSPLYCARTMLTSNGGEVPESILRRRSCRRPAARHR